MKKLIALGIVTCLISLLIYLVLTSNAKLDNFSQRIEIVDTPVLRMAILQSIKSPFDLKQSDTLLLGSGWSLCGNMTKAEIENLPKFFDTNFEEKYYCEKLSASLEVPVISYANYFDFVTNHPTSSETYDSLFSSKVKVNIMAEIAKDNGHVLVHEVYNHNETNKTIDKEFVLDQFGKWQFR